MQNRGCTVPALLHARGWGPLRSNDQKTNEWHIELGRMSLDLSQRNTLRYPYYQLRLEMAH
jgi:hypothetical protein